MGRETTYQSKIIKGIKALGGWAITGSFSTAGEADIQGGYPYDDILYYIAIETKTEEDYYRVMAALRLEDDNTYTIIDDKKLKKHEPLQIEKINEVRERGGLALFAYELRQVMNYVEEELT